MHINSNALHLTVGGDGGRRRWEVRIKVMRTRGYLKAAAEEKNVAKTIPSKHFCSFDDGWEVRIKVMRTRGYPKAAAEEKNIAKTIPSKHFCCQPNVTRFCEKRGHVAQPNVANFSSSVSIKEIQQLW